LKSNYFQYRTCPNEGIRDSYKLSDQDCNRRRRNSSKGVGTKFRALATLYAIMKGVPIYQNGANLEGRSNVRHAQKGPKRISLKILYIYHRMESRLESIEKRLEGIEKGIEKMSNHVNFVERTYDVVRKPLNYILGKISGPSELPPIKIPLIDKE